MPATTAPKMRADLDAIAPERVKRLPVDPVRGFPVPWFVAYVDGKPEFRVAEAGKYRRAVRERLCWVCGEPLGRRVFFVIGPMCVINRISADPPTHRDCGIFSVKACPFLVRPQMERREENLPPQAGGTFGGTALLHNPGVTVLYMPMDHEHRSDGAGGYLFHLGEPLDEVLWWTLGRLATREEAVAAFAIGSERLRGMASEQGRDAIKEFDRLHARALPLLPEEPQ